MRCGGALLLTVDQRQALFLGRSLAMHVYTYIFFTFRIVSTLTKLS